MSENIRDVADLSFKEHGILLLKRCVALPSKMIGFKPFCLYLATWLLWCGKIDGWVWLCVLCAVLFGIVGLKVFAQLYGVGKPANYEAQFSPPQTPPLPCTSENEQNIGG